MSSAMKTDGQVLYEAYVIARGCEPHWEQLFHATRTAWEVAATKLEIHFDNRLRRQPDSTEPQVVLRER